MNPYLPNHVVSKILEIDKRRALLMRPGPVKRLISVDAYSTLANLFLKRSNMWARYSEHTKVNSNTFTSLSTFSSPRIPQANSNESCIQICICDIGKSVLMQFEKLMFVAPRPGSRWEFLGPVPYTQGSVHCDVQTGELVERVFDDDM